MRRLFKHETEDIKVEINFSPEKMSQIKDKLLEFALKHDMWLGESFMQSDNPIIEAPVLVSEIFDDILKPKITYK